MTSHFEAVKKQAGEELHVDHVDGWADAHDGGADADDSADAWNGAHPVDIGLILMTMLIIDEEETNLQVDWGNQLNIPHFAKMAPVWQTLTIFSPPQPTDGKEWWPPLLPPSSSSK